jgi:hypothetical protein
MADTLGKDKASPVEHDKLVSELQRLVAEKGLDVELKVKRAVAAQAQGGCTSCTVCPCMICW